VSILVKAIKELALSEGTIITSEFEGEEKPEKGITVKYIPLWKWLLASDGM